MTESGSDKNDRKYQPAPIWKAKVKKVGSPRSDPPISKRVTLPETVTPRFLAEITGQELPRVVEELKRLRLYLGDKRSIGFEAAAKFLRKYGIGADKDDA